MKNLEKYFTRDKVTIIVVLFRYHDNFISLIKNIKKTTYPLVEKIIINNNFQNSDFQKKVNKLVVYDDTVKFFPTGKEVNANVARNIGLDNATGKYIKFLDDDDIFYPDSIERLMYYQKKFPDFLIYAKNFNKYDNSRKDHCLTKERLVIRNVKKDLLTLNYSETPNILNSIVERKFLIDYGIKFDENFERHQDIDFFLQIAKIKKMLKVDFRVGEYIMKSSKIKTRKKNNQKHLLDAKKKIFSKYQVEIKKESDNLIYERNIKELVSHGIRDSIEIPDIKTIKIKTILINKGEVIIDGIKINMKKNIETVLKEIEEEYIYISDEKDNILITYKKEFDILTIKKTFTFFENEYIIGSRIDLFNSEGGISIKNKVIRKEFIQDVIRENKIKTLGEYTDFVFKIYKYKNCKIINKLAFESEKNKIISLCEKYYTIQNIVKNKQLLPNYLYHYLIKKYTFKDLKNEYNFLTEIEKTKELYTFEKIAITNIIDENFNFYNYICKTVVSKKYI